MKKKRLLSLVLALALVIGLIPAAMGETVTSAVDAGYNTSAERPSVSELFSTAYVRNRGAETGENGTPGELEVVVELKTFTSPNTLYAVVMLASDYDGVLNGGPAASNLDSTRYYKLAVPAANRDHYAMARGTAANAAEGDTVALPLVEPSAANDKALGGGETVGSKSLPLTAPADDSVYYHEEYVLIVFGRETGDSGETDRDSRYYIDRFYLDSEGYVRTPSYLIRYNANNPAGTGTVSGVPGHQVVRTSWQEWMSDRGALPGNTTLSTAVPTRTGYEFVGWTTDERAPLGKDDPTPTDSEFYAAGGAYTQPTVLDKVYDLYALWRVVPVEFNKSASATPPVRPEGTDYVIDWPTAPQVGVPFTTGPIAYQTPGTAGAEPDGDKTFSVEVTTGTGAGAASYTLPAGHTADTAGNVYGFTVSRVDDNAHWGVSVTPKTHSDDKPVRLTITVTDPSNNTTDVISVLFDKIEKGAQPVPTLDDNTGIETRLMSTGEGESATVDGQIYGFYSGGPRIGTDTGYLPSTTDPKTGTYGTGTMTGYYLELGMVFEYRPYKIGETVIDWTAGTDAPGTVSDPGDTPATNYTDMPNGGWRELPFPESWYAGAADDTATARGQLTATMLLNAAALAESTKAGAGSAALTVDTPTGFAGWMDAYGEIAFENGLPIIKGLHEGDQYQIRFRANANYAASEPKLVTIGGAVSAGGTGDSGHSVVFNLMGGKIYKVAGATMSTSEPTSGEVTLENMTGLATTTDPVSLTAIEVGAGNHLEFWKDGKRYDTLTFRDSNGGTHTLTKSGPSSTDWVLSGGIAQSVGLAAAWSANTDDFCTVVFYDWDGTLLGTRIVAKGGSLKGDSAETAGDRDSDDPICAPLPPEGELLWDVDGDGEYDFLGNNNAGNDAKNKEGYTFAGWVDYETGYSVPNVASTDRIIAKIPESDLVSLSNITEDLVLKAAYNENNKLSTGVNMTTNPNLRRYLISYTPFVRSGTTISTTVTIRRPENARRSVEGEIYLQVVLQPKGLGQTTMKIPLGAKDLEQFTLTMPAGANTTYNVNEAVRLTVINHQNTAVSAPTSVKAAELS